MTQPNQPRLPRRLAIIGGGITGLSAAFRGRELSPECEVTLFEAGARVGGALHTVRREGFLIELGADNFITSVPWGLDLWRRIGLSNHLLESNPQFRRAMVVRDGQLYPVPEGFMLMEPRQVLPVLRSPLLSLPGKLRLLAEFFVPARRGADDESLASFARRRLGREAFDRLVQPLVSGIYTADPEKLSLAATLPRFLEMERKHGSLIRAARRRKEKSAEATAAGSAARYSLFVAPRDGMQSIADTIVTRLPASTVQLNTRVQSLRPAGDAAGGWELSIQGEAAPRMFDAVILATPAYAAAECAAGFDAEMSRLLASIPYASSAVVVAAYEQQQFLRPIDSFGFVVPDVERRPIIAGSFASVKYPGRAPAGCVLVRIFFGGALRPELASASEDELLSIASEELRTLLGVRGKPLFTRIARWARAMPQYHVGHMRLVAEIDQRVAAWEGLAVAGSAYQGVGVPGCIHSGEQAAERVLSERLE